MLSSQACMNREKFEALIVSLAFERFPKETQEFFTSIMSMPVETVIIGEAMVAKVTATEVAMAVEGAAPEVAIIEVPT